jgi:hypothetical protein
VCCVVLCAGHALKGNFAAKHSKGKQSSRADGQLGVHLSCCRHPRLLGAGPGSKVGPNHVFGMPSARESEPCVGELIRGGCGQQQHEQEVDPGLGRSPTRWRNTSETAERVSYCERAAGAG